MYGLGWREEEKEEEKEKKEREGRERERVPEGRRWEIAEGVGGVGEGIRRYIWLYSTVYTYIYIWNILSAFLYKITLTEMLCDLLTHWNIWTVSCSGQICIKVPKTHGSLCGHTWFSCVNACQQGFKNTPQSHIYLCKKIPRYVQSTVLFKVLPLARGGSSRRSASSTCLHRLSDNVEPSSSCVTGSRQWWCQMRGQVIQSACCSDIGSVFRNHMGWLTTTYNFSSASTPQINK